MQSINGCIVRYLYAVLLLICVTYAAESPTSTPTPAAIVHTNSTPTPPVVTPAATPAPPVTPTPSPAPDATLLLTFNEFSSSTVATYLRTIAAVLGLSDTTRLQFATEQNAKGETVVAIKPWGLKTVVKLKIFADRTNLASKLVTSKSDARLADLALEDVQIINAGMSWANEPDRSGFSEGWYFLIAYGLLNIAVFVWIWKKRGSERGGAAQRLEDDGDRVAGKARLMPSVAVEQQDDVIVNDMEALYEDAVYLEEQTEAHRKLLQSPERIREFQEMDEHLPKLVHDLYGGDEKYALPPSRSRPNTNATNSRRDSAVALSASQSQSLSQPLLSPKSTTALHSSPRRDGGHLTHQDFNAGDYQPPKERVSAMRKLLNTEDAFRLPPKRTTTATAAADPTKATAADMKFL